MTLLTKMCITCYELEYFIYYVEEDNVGERSTHRPYCCQNIGTMDSGE